ncbi:hypothetical protein WK94_23340 [Burkholderia ubonensis]|nr:hypothetical protein WK94_23340 [Burkholderia ubonensis]OJA27768.1 hypothetical protein BGX87_20585 [Burkholderia ubonensis]
MDGEAAFSTKECEAVVEIRDDGTGACPVRINIEGEWMTAADLRHIAKLLKRVAQRLEDEGRTA